MDIEQVEAPAVVEEGDYRGLRYAVVSDAVVYPHRPGSVKAGVAPFPGAPTYFRHRRWRPDRLAPLPGLPADADQEFRIDEDEVRQTLPGTHWYVGALDRHFGHCVTESMTRSWFPLSGCQEAGRPVVVPHTVSANHSANFGPDDLKGFHRELFEYFGIDDPVLVNQPIRLERLVVPEQAALLYSDYHSPSYREVLAAYDLARQGPRSGRRRVFFRRQLSSTWGGLAGESYLGEFLGEQGYVVVRPELLPLAEQLTLARHASKVIGVQGSAFHLFNLLGKVETDVLTIQRLSDWTSKAFTMTLEPYVGTLTTVPAATRLQGAGGSPADLVVADLDALLGALALFDPDLDIACFRVDDFYRAVADDLKHRLG